MVRAIRFPFFKRRGTDEDEFTRSYDSWQARFLNELPKPVAEETKRRLKRDSELIRRSLITGKLVLEGFDENDQVSVFNVDFFNGDDVIAEEDELEPLDTQPFVPLQPTNPPKNKRVDSLDSDVSNDRFRSMGSTSSKTISMETVTPRNTSLRSIVEPVTPQTVLSTTREKLQSPQRISFRSSHSRDSPRSTASTAQFTVGSPVNPTPPLDDEDFPLYTPAPRSLSNPTPVVKPFEAIYNPGHKGQIDKGSIPPKHSPPSAGNSQPKKLQRKKATTPASPPLGPPSSSSKPPSSKPPKLSLSKPPSSKPPVKPFASTCPSSPQSPASAYSTQSSPSFKKESKRKSPKQPANPSTNTPTRSTKPSQKLPRDESSKKESSRKVSERSIETLASLKEISDKKAEKSTQFTRIKPSSPPTMPGARKPSFRGSYETAFIPTSEPPAIPTPPGSASPSADESFNMSYENFMKRSQKVLAVGAID
ncbi:hypothetical protein DICA1_E21814 [Diutina catenulata]